MSSDVEEFTDEPIPRSPLKFTREEWQKFLNLNQQQQWLEKKQSEFFDLIELCKDAEEQNLIVNLLYNFTYLNSEKLGDCIAQICERIVNIWKLTPKNTLIAAAEKSSEADSSKMIFYNISTQINKFSSPSSTWSEKKNFADSINSAIPKITPHIENVVLVDEFSGSGAQMSKRLKAFNKMLLGLNRSPLPTVRVCVVASMEEAQTKTKGLSEEYFASIWLKKGISDHYDGEELKKARKLMLRLESELEELGRNSFGWDKTEALYSMDVGIGRVPNNVFPIFWWRYLKNGQERLTLLSR